MSLLDRYLRIRIVAAEPEALLTKLIEANTELIDVQWLDYLTVEIKIQKVQFFTVREVLDKEGINYRIVKKEGMLWYLQGLGKRPVLFFGVTLFVLLAYILPGRIFFIAVTGNETLADKQILQQVENYGIRFGAKAADIRSENAKNYMLSQLPELQWIGVTTSGCVVTIHVKERSIPNEQGRMKNAVCSIVAAQDGVITQLNIYKGTSVVQLGQSVKAGDLLVSGYADCGLKITAQQADGEIFAHTLRKVSAITPLATSKRDNDVREHTCYRLRIGKKVINLCNHSGIPDATCVKMYSEDYWALPGGYQLPVSVIKENCVFYESSSPDHEKETYDWLAQYITDYLQTQMIAGEVLNASLNWNMTDEFCELRGNYACHEMIGQVKCEETIEQYAEDN